MINWAGCYFDEAEGVGYVFNDYGREVVTTWAKAGAQIRVSGSGGQALRVPDESDTASSLSRFISVDWDSLGSFSAGLARETGAKEFALKADYDRARDAARAARSAFLAECKALFAATAYEAIRPLLCAGCRPTPTKDLAP